MLSTVYRSAKRLGIEFFLGRSAVVLMSASFYLVGCTTQSVDESASNLPAIVEQIDESNEDSTKPNDEGTVTEQLTDSPYYGNYFPTACLHVFPEHQTTFAEMDDPKGGLSTSYEPQACNGCGIQRIFLCVGSADCTWYTENPIECTTCTIDTPQPITIGTEFGVLELGDEFVVEFSGDSASASTAAVVYPSNSDVVESIEFRSGIGLPSDASFYLGLRVAPNCKPWPP